MDALCQQALADNFRRLQVIDMDDVGVDSACINGTAAADDFGLDAAIHIDAALDYQTVRYQRLIVDRFTVWDINGFHIRDTPFLSFCRA